MAWAFLGSREQQRDEEWERYRERVHGDTVDLARDHEEWVHRRAEEQWEEARDLREWQEAHPDWAGLYSSDDANDADERDDGRDDADWEDATILPPRHAFSSSMAGPSSAGAGPSGVSHDDDDLVLDDRDDLLDMPSSMSPPPPVFSDDMLDEEELFALAVEMSLAEMRDE